MTNPLYLADWEVRISKFDDYVNPMVNVYVFRRDTEKAKTQVLVFSADAEVSITEQEPGNMLTPSMVIPEALLKGMIVGLVNEAQRLNIPVPDKQGLLEEVQKDKAWLKGIVEQFMIKDKVV